MNQHVRVQRPDDAGNRGASVPGGPVEVFRTRSPKLAREYGLVLQATGLHPFFAQAEGLQLVLVPEAEGSRAVAQIRLYEDENRGWPGPEELPDVLSEGSVGVGVWVVALVAVYLLQTHRGFGIDWTRTGASVAELVRDGEWWRSFTALTLHADILHLANNLVFGGLFVGVVCQLLGTGLALQAIVLAGALGNFANAWLQGPDFSSIGASTAVFGALGVLGGNRWQRRRKTERARRRSWIPLLAALFLLAYLGMGGERPGRIDVLGHVCGFVAGVVVGVAYGRWNAHVDLSARSQALLGGGAIAAWGVAWWLAITSV